MILVGCGLGLKGHYGKFSMGNSRHFSRGGAIGQEDLFLVPPFIACPSILPVLAQQSAAQPLPVNLGRGLGLS